MNLKRFFTAKPSVASFFMPRSLRLLAWFRQGLLSGYGGKGAVVNAADTQQPCRGFGLGGALFAAALLAFTVGCDSGKDTATAAGGGVPAQQSEGASSRRAAPLPAQTYFPLQLGDKEIRVQLALTDAERGRGLMGRKALDTDHGMLFVFEQPSRQSFWMANTPLPLDIGYFDGAGILREVYPLYPFDRTSVVSRRSDIRYALEMTQGWFAQNGIRPGAALDVEALGQALRSRGF